MATGTCIRCNQPCCDRHWGRAAAPRCERCHVTVCRLWTAAGLAVLALALALIFFAPFAVTVVLMFLGAGLLCVGAVPFRSAAARAAAEAYFRGTDEYDENGE
jgi:hypothetical protein